MYTKLVIIVFLSWIHFQGFSQKLNSKKVKELKNKTLLIGLEEIDEKLVKKLKTNELETYKNQIEGNNNALKEAIEKYWKFSTDIQYMSFNEAKELMKKQPEKYFLMRYNKYTDYWRSKSGAGWNRNNGVLQYDWGVRYKEVANEVMTLNLDIPSTALMVNLPNLYVSNSDAVYGVMQMQYILNRLNESEDDKLDFRDIVKECNSKILKGKTLLLDKNDVDSDLNWSEIKAIYKYNFKIVTSAEIEKAIINLDPNYAIIQIVSLQVGKGNVNAHIIHETQTGRILGYVVPTVAFGIQGTSLITYNSKIKKKQLKEYLESAECEK